MTSWSKKKWHFAVCLGLSMVFLVMPAECGTCVEDVGTSFEEINIDENTPSGTVLKEITTGHTLEILDEAAADAIDPPFLKVENGTLLTARDAILDGDENKDFCEKAILTLYRRVGCKNEGSNNFRRFIIVFNLTNDYPTEFNFQPVNVRELAFNAPVIDLGDVAIKDKFAWDKDCNNEVRLEIIEDDDTRDYFRVEGKAIYTKTALDYEMRKQHIFNVSAVTMVQKQPFSTFMEQLVINVVDVDDRNPYFYNDIYNLELSETEEAGQMNASGPVISATDGDTGINATLEYSVFSSDPTLNAVITDDGKLTVTGPIDRETASTYKVIVKAQQEDNPMATATATVSLTITDINDNRPKFSDAQEIKATIKETASAGSHVTWLQASDADAGENALFQYTIYEDTGAFEIKRDPVANLAELVVKNSSLLNGKDSAIVNIRLEELQEAEGGDACDYVNFCGDTIVVTIEDDNDNTPVFKQPRYTWTIFNDQDIDVSLGKIEATDDDKGKNAQVQYTLSRLPGDGSPDCDKVQVATLTGVVTLKQRMMAEVTCYFTVEACDSPVVSRDRRCANALVTISVEESPSAGGSTDVVLYDAHILEGLGVGTTVMELPATGLVTENTNFTIEGRLLKTARELDREQQNVHAVSVGRRNGLQFVEVLRIAVYVDNVNDNPPVFDSDNYEIRLTDGDRAGLVVLNVSATDADGPEDSLTFSLLNMNGVFNIASGTGQVSLAVPASEAAALDDGTSAELQGNNNVLFVEARDSGVPPFKTTTNVQVNFPWINETVSVMVPVRKDKLMQDKAGVESKLSQLLGVSVQVLRIESLGGVQDLGSKILLKQDSQDGQSISVQELNKLIEQHEKAIHNAFAEKYNDDSNVNDGSKPDDDDDDDDDGLSTLVIVLICLVAVLFLILLIIAFLFYRTRKQYQSELSLLKKLNKNTSIYDRAPLFPEASSTTNGSVQGTAFNQNGSPRRESINLVAYSNDAYVADNEENDPTYSRIQETLGNGRHHTRSTGQSTRYLNGREVTGSTQSAQDAERARESSTSPPPPVNGQLASAADTEEEPVYSNPRSSRSNNANPNPVFRTTIDVVYPRLEASETTHSPVESSTDSTPLSRNPYPNVSDIGNNGCSPGANWSFGRNSRLELQQQSPANTSVGPNERGDFDDVDSNLVSPAFSRQRRGSMKAGSESDSGLPSDRDLRLDDETDLDTAMTLHPSPGKGNSPIYPNIYSGLQPENARPNPAPMQTRDIGSSVANSDFMAPYDEPEPDYNKRVRFEEAKRRGEMVELPRPDSIDVDAGETNQDTEITTL